MFTYLTHRSFVAFGEGNRATDHKERSFFTYYEQNLQLSTNSTIPISLANFQDYDIKQFQAKFITEQFRRFPGAFLIETYSRFTTGTVMDDRSAMRRLLSVWKNTKKLNMNEGQLVLNSFKLVVTIMI